MIGDVYANEHESRFFTDRVGQTCFWIDSNGCEQQGSKAEVDLWAKSATKQPPLNAVLLVGKTYVSRSGEIRKFIHAKVGSTNLMRGAVQWETPNGEKHIALVVEVANWLPFAKEVSCEQ